MTTGYDVGKNRLDDLDRMIIRNSVQEEFASQIVCNMGAGESALSRALAALGHKVYNYDNRDLSLYYVLQQEIGLCNYFQQIDIVDIKKHLLPKQYDAVILQRVLHYFTFAQAARILLVATKNLKVDGRVYVAFSGIDSILSENYQAKDIKIESRFDYLSPKNQEQFNIKQPVCLYSQQEAERLVTTVGDLEIEKIWQSQFGNIKVVCRKV